VSAGGHAIGGFIRFPPGARTGAGRRAGGSGPPDGGMGASPVAAVFPLRPCVGAFVVPGPQLPGDPIPTEGAFPGADRDTLRLGRRGLTLAVITPANHRSVLHQPADVKTPGTKPQSTDLTVRGWGYAGFSVVREREGWFCAGCVRFDGCLLGLGECQTVQGVCGDALNSGGGASLCWSWRKSGGGSAELWQGADVLEGGPVGGCPWPVCG